MGWLADDEFILICKDTSNEKKLYGKCFGYFENFMASDDLSYMKLGMVMYCVA